jgi:hypothetical protein
VERGVDLVNKFLIGLALVTFVAVGSVGVWKATGDDRRVGAIGPLEEPVALAWRGAWTEAGKYDAGQVVSFEGASYVAEAPNDGLKPNAKEGPWALMAAAGLQGPAGSFNGTYQSPNGSYSLVVANDGIVMTGPSGTIRLRDTGVELAINRSVSVNAAQALTLQAGSTGLLKAGGALTVEAGGQLRLKGATIQQN